MHTEVHWELERCPKAGNTGTTPLLYHHFHVLELPIQIYHFWNLYKLNFCNFYFHITRLHVKHTKICTTRKFGSLSTQNNIWTRYSNIVCVQSWKKNSSHKAALNEANKFGNHKWWYQRLPRQWHSYPNLYPTRFVYDQAHKWQQLIVPKLHVAGGCTKAPLPS